MILRHIAHRLTFLPVSKPQLTDSSLYTGAHKHRFDANGNGRGLSGRDRVGKVGETFLRVTAHMAQGASRPLKQAPSQLICVHVTGAWIHCWNARSALRGPQPDYTEQPEHERGRWATVQ